MTVRFTIREPVAENTTQLVTAVIKDEQNQPIPGSALTALTLTLYALDAARTIINSRNQQNIKGANGGSVDEQGNLTLELGTNDNIIVDTSTEVEHHILLFEFTYAGGTKAGKQELEIKVVNLEKVPAP